MGHVDVVSDQRVTGIEKCKWHFIFVVTDSDDASTADSLENRFAVHQWDGIGFRAGDDHTGNRKFKELHFFNHDDLAAGNANEMVQKESNPQ